jgi:hypothetical protein
MFFRTKLTPTGAAKLAAAAANKTTLKLSEMVLGDGGGAAVPQATGNEKGLVNEVYRGTLNELEPSASDPTIVLVSMAIAPDVGGFFIRELVVVDEDGDVIVYGNFPDTYKPVPADGSSRDMTVQVAMKVGNASLVQLTVDVSIVGASRDWVAENFAPIDSPEFTGTPKAPTPAKGDRSTLIPSTQWVGNEFAPLASPEFTGTPKAPTPARGNRSTLIPSTQWVGNEFAALDGAVFTATPSTPAPPSNDSSTLIPNTAWVQAYVESVSGNYVVDTGAVNAPVVALNPPITAYTPGLTVSFRAKYANTGACTLNAGGGAIALKRDDGAALQAGDIQLGAIVTAVYDKPLGYFLATSIVLSQLGAVAKLGLGNGVMNDGSGNISVSGPTYLSAAATLLAGKYLVDTSGGALTVTLPASPPKGRVITLVDAAGSWRKNNLTVARNGKTIMGYSEDLTVKVSDLEFSIWYNGSDWRLL